MPTIILAYDGNSDGDETRQPSGPGWTRCEPDWVRRVYLTKVAQKYKDATGPAEKQHNYVLARLPPGYVVWEKTRNDGRIVSFHCVC